MSDSYKNWIERVVADRESKPVSTGDIISLDPPQPFGPISFVEVTREKYRAELGKKGDDYIYHFFPTAETTLVFEDKFGDAFIEVFKRPGQLEAIYSDDLQSWAVKVRGFVATLWGDDLAISVFDVLDKLLEK